MENNCENCIDLAKQRGDRVLQDFKIAELEKKIEELENDIRLKDEEIHELEEENMKIKKQKYELQVKLHHAKHKKEIDIKNINATQ